MLPERAENRVDIAPVEGARSTTSHSSGHEGGSGPGQRNGRDIFSDFIRWTIVHEPALLRRSLPEAERETFFKYYDKLPSPGDERGILRYIRGLWRGEAGWTARWIAARQAQSPGRTVRVLDAGCGFGSFSFLFASFGAEVTAADIRPDRLDVARWRRTFMTSVTRDPGDVVFRRMDVTREIQGSYDLVWVYNALSHIEPPEQFLEHVCAHLRPDGIIVISDLNGGNLRRVHALEAKRTEIHSNYVARDGERHAYAVERPFTPGELRELLKSTGFRVTRHRIFYGGLASLPRLLLFLVRPFHLFWRLGARWARRQFVVATPAPGPSTRR